MIDPFKGYIKAGYVQKTHGLDGCVVIDLSKKLQKFQSITIELETFLVPFIVLKYEQVGNKFFTFFRGISSVDEAKFLKGMDVFVHPEVLSEDELESHNLLGYCVYDKIEGYIGIVENVLAHSSIQKILSVKRITGDILIPYHKNLIINVDDRTREIVFDLPQGFLG